MKQPNDKSATALVIIGLAACGLHIGILLVTVYFGFRQEQLNGDFFVSIAHLLNQGFFIPNFILVVASMIGFNHYRTSRVGVVITGALSLFMAILNVFALRVSILAPAYVLFWVALPYTLWKLQKQPNQAL